MELASLSEKSFSVQETLFLLQDGRLHHQRDACNGSPTKRTRTFSVSGHQHLAQQQKASKQLTKGTRFHLPSFFAYCRVCFATCGPTLLMIIIFIGNFRLPFLWQNTATRRYHDMSEAWCDGPQDEQSMCCASTCSNRRTI